VCPKNAKGHVAKYRYTLDEDINGKVVEHVVVDQHPYEMITKICWEMDGAENLRFPQRFEHRTKVNAVTRGQPGQDTTLFNEDMWLDLEDVFRMYNRMLTKGSHLRQWKGSSRCCTQTTSADSSSNALLVSRWQPVKG
jgi:hypothetical protein